MRFIRFRRSGARRTAFRPTAAAAVVVFAVTTGITGVEAHPLSVHAHAGELLALELGTALPGPAGHGDAARATAGHLGHHAPSGAAGHSGHSHHGSSDDCTCVGPCAGGAPPTLSPSTRTEIWLDGPSGVRAVPVPVRLIAQDPRSYLRPLPNGPPSRV